MALVYDRRQVELSFAVPEWFREMPDGAQKQYLEDHPNSRISKIVKHSPKLFKKGSDKLEDVKGTPAQEVLQKKGSPTDYQGPRSAGNSLTGEPRKERRIVVMMDKLAKLASIAKQKGKEMPDFDLCQITIPGSNLFCSQNKGIPRKDMPQFKTKAVPDSWADKNLEKNKDGEVDAEHLYRKMLEDKGVKMQNKAVDVAVLKATQSQLVGPKVAGMMQALKKDPNNKGINAPIYVSKDGYIVDGHHRWAALVMLAMADGLPDPVQMEVIEVDMEIEDLIDETNKWADSIGLATKAGKQKESASVIKDCCCGRGDDGDEKMQTSGIDDDVDFRLPRPRAQYTPVVEEVETANGMGEPPLDNRNFDQNGLQPIQHQLQYYIKGSKTPFMDTGIRCSIQDMAKNENVYAVKFAERVGSSSELVVMQLLDKAGLVVWSNGAPEVAGSSGLELSNPELQKRADQFLNDTNPYTGVYDSVEEVPAESAKLRIRTLANL